MRVRLEYARTGLEVDLPDERVVRSLAYKNAEPLADPQASFGRRVGQSHRHATLAELARGARTLHRDLRYHAAGAQRNDPHALLAALEAAGIPRDKITILIATGLHRPNEGEELIELVGAEIATRYRVENHRGQESTSTPI